MPAKRKAECIRAKYFEWLLSRRENVFYADGRANRPPVGRHSLATKDYREAVEAVHKLDLVCAVNSGLADREALGNIGPRPLDLDEGWRLYRDFLARPRVAGGAKTVSVKRYRAIFDKLLPFLKCKGHTTWNCLSAETLSRYAAWLVQEDYAYRTQYVELTTIKQAIRWMVKNKLLPSDSLIHLTLVKPEGTDRYCWRPQEVSAMIAHCREHRDLNWLGDVLVALACTGLRISELASCRWSDIDLKANVIRVPDESAAVQSRGTRRRETKSGRSRSFPIHDDLRRVLEQLERLTDNRVFHGPRGGVIKPDTLRNILIRDVITPLARRFPTPEGEVGFRDGRLHSFRHFFCSSCANAGVPEPVVMLWLGHRESAMVRHYFHLHSSDAQRQMQKLSLVDNFDGMVAAG